MKKCKACNKKKSLDEFYRNHKMADGRLNTCKRCWIDKDRSKEGHIQKMWNSMNSRVKNNPSYQEFQISFTRKEFFGFVIGNEYEEMHEAWVNSGYERGLCPTVDRIDPYKGYSIENIQIITREDNLERDRRMATNKLEAEQVNEIRRRKLNNPSLEHKDLSDMFGVSRPTISLILSWETWTNQPNIDKTLQP